MNMETIKKQAAMLSKYLHVVEIQGVGERTTWADNTPSEVKDWFLNTTSERQSFADLSEQYKILDTLCDLIHDSDAITKEALEDEIGEHGWADTGNNIDLLSWLSGNLFRIGDVDNAIKEGAPGIIEAIQMAQERNRIQKAIDILNSFGELATGY